MAYLALYRKYRPDSFDDVIGQEKIIKVISNAILNNKVSHAYLFSGPRGTGKTTTAKIIAKMVNCENLIDGRPCNKCDSCKNILNSNDIVEIDAASNNGVDEIREIRNKVNLVPSSCKFKVYIIDEVHMLTTQAFNALLKTLEEPPKHVIFILTTTEFYKIPMTVVSRCQKFQFTKIDDVDIVKRLEVISNKENILVEKDALYEIARLADGGLRDAINLLDQLTAYKSSNIKLDDVYKISGSVSYVDLYNLLLCVFNNKCKDIIIFVEKFDKDGKNLTKFVEEIIVFLKDILIYKNTNSLTNIEEKNKYILTIDKMIDDEKIYDFINNLNDLLMRLKYSDYQAILLIVELLKFSKMFNSIFSGKDVIEEEKNKINDYESKVILDKEKSDENEEIVDDVLIDNRVRIRVNNSFATAKKEILLSVKEKWNLVSNYLLNDTYSSVAGLLSDVNPIVASDRYLMLECKYDANADRINQFDEDISKLLKNIYDREFKIVAISSERWKKEKDKYVKDRKKGIVYNIIDEDNDINKISTRDDSLSKLVDLLGEDLIEYK